MYVRKFEGDTLDEALKQVKTQLGPDAIILKTVTNKGLKGAFKKSRIEITAAISEESYTKKARVDNVLDDNQRERFYQAPSTAINQMINEYDGHKPKAQNQGYGNLGLNKVVNTVSKATSTIRNSLDDFLTQEESESSSAQSFDEFTQGHDEDEAPNYQEVEQQIERHDRFIQANQHQVDERLVLQIETQKKQIEALEQKLFDLAKNRVSEERHDISQGLDQLKVNLQALDINQTIIAKILKKAQFELSPDDLENEDTVFEFGLRELSAIFNTAMPLFSTTDDSDEPVITTLISESSAGQTSMAFKLAAMMENAVIIRYRKESVESISHEFAKSIFKLNIVEVDSTSHMLTEIRKAVADKKKIILDLKLNSNNVDDSKKVLDALKRSWKKSEFIAVTSAIHSEQYNRKIISKYQSHLDGVIITHIDQCLNYGAVLNVHYKFNNIPLKFFGTGATIPDDMEAASSERILAGMFNL
jgi:flagellar biosynthesis protein FlhF